MITKYINTWLYNEEDDDDDEIELQRKIQEKTMDKYGRTTPQTQCPVLNLGETYIIQNILDIGQKNGTNAIMDLIAYFYQKYGMPRASCLVPRAHDK